LGTLRRILVYGNSGSGKSTAAARLAGTLQVPHVEIDVLAFDHRRRPVDFDLLGSRIRAALASDGWMLEGMHRDELRRAMSRADTFIWLDTPLRIVATRLARRSLGLLLRRQQRHGRAVTIRSWARAELPFLVGALRKHGLRRA
jgi:adenylate kinase family enzyme